MDILKNNTSGISTTTTANLIIGDYINYKKLCIILKKSLIIYFG